MNKRMISVLVFGVVVSALASFIVYRLIAARMVASASTPVIPVVVATHDLTIGTLIKDIDVSVVNWPGKAPQGASSRQEDIVGRGVVAAIVQGEPIIDSRLAPKGAGAGLAATIPQGMRAVAVGVNEVVGLAGFAVPGMRVDVLISGSAPGQGAAMGSQTRTLLQNIQVLSAGQNIQKDAEGKPITVQVVNLLVTPEQAETLSLATHETRIQLVLRNPMDTEITKTSGTAVASLFGSPAKPAAPAGPARIQPKPPPPVQVAAPQKVIVPLIVEIITGSHKAEAKFQPEPETETKQ